MRTNMAAHALGIVAVLFAATLAVQPVDAAEARAFRVQPANAKTIDPARDHVTVRIVSGWTSAEDSFFQALLGKSDKLIVAAAATVVNFDGVPVNTVALLLENTDIGKKVDTPWGADKIIVDRVPADSAKIALNLRTGIDKSSRFGGVLGAFSKSAPASLELGSAEWFGYAKALVSVLDELFGTDKTKYPFIWVGDLRGADIKTEHYLVLIAKNSVNDKILDGLTDAKLAYDGKQVKVNGQPLVQHSYAVLHVGKSEPYDIVTMSYESKAPWAALAQSSFLSAAKFQPKNADELQGLSATRLSDLDNELLLLKEEPRFSSYDRALALHTFAVAVRARIAVQCKRLSLQDAQCPTSDADHYIDQIATRFKLGDELKKTLAKESLDLFQAAAVRSFIDAP